LPDGKYRLCLATRGIDESGLAPVIKSEAIEAGRHAICLEQQNDNAGWLITAGWDGRRLLSVHEPKEWNPGSGSTGGGEYSQCTQLAADQPLILYRRRFNLPGGAGQVATPSTKRDFGRFSGRLKSHGPARAVGAGSESTSRRLSSQGTRCSAALKRSKTGCNASCSANSSSQTTTASGVT
jgi:hypothetical protein